MDKGDPAVRPRTTQAATPTRPTDASAARVQAIAAELQSLLYDASMASTDLEAALREWRTAGIDVREAAAASRVDIEVVERVYGGGSILPLLVQRFADRNRR